MSLNNSTMMAPFNATTFTTTTDNPESYDEYFRGILVESVLHYKLSSRALAQNLPLLNGLYVGILFTMALHVGLFYFQMWKPFKAKEEENKEDGEEKENENENEKGRD